MGEIWNAFVESGPALRLGGLSKEYWAYWKIKTVFGRESSTSNHPEA